MLKKSLHDMNAAFASLISLHCNSGEREGKGCGGVWVESLLPWTT